ncbi:hypothetical protein H6P81_014705 [Aristolochia fimbriata]|uniref:Uncharacterized protein n=1 Tax=Aristolochia fimbriata TaxID=158543 RepID=A0AAV7E5F1_ARIFI|nr:hypothetical protein H6P81_014705 [Aristolochia fimbriata]
MAVRAVWQSRATSDPVNLGSEDEVENSRSSIFMLKERTHYALSPPPSSSLVQGGGRNRREKGRGKNRNSDRGDPRDL